MDRVLRNLNRNNVSIFPVLLDAECKQISKLDFEKKIKAISQFCLMPDAWRLVISGSLVMNACTFWDHKMRCHCHRLMPHEALM